MTWLKCVISAGAHRAGAAYWYTASRRVAGGIRSGAIFPRSSRDLAGRRRTVPALGYHIHLFSRRHKFEIGPPIALNWSLSKWLPAFLRTQNQPSWSRA